MASLSPSEVRRRALLAATKVSLSASLIAGCGGLVEEQTTVAALDAEVVDSVAAVTIDTGVVDVNDASDAREAGDASRCAAIVQSALADAGDPATSTDPEVQACCKEILPVWTFGGMPEVSYEAARACCQVLGGDKWWELGFPACTPWGPPMPPSMDEVVA